MNSFMLNYYHPWNYAGSERFHQLALAELRMGRTVGFLYVSDAGVPDLVRRRCAEDSYHAFRVYRLDSDGKAEPISPAAVAATGEQSVSVRSAIRSLEDAYARAHYPVKLFRQFMDKPWFDSVPFMYDVMDLWTDFTAAPWGDDDDEAYFVERADLVVAVSRSLVERFEDQRPTVLVPNGVDAAFLELLEEAAPRGERIAGAPKRVLYMGGLGGSWYDWETTFATVDGLPDCAFTFIGGTGLPPEETDDGVQREIDALVADLARRPNVTVWPEIDHDELVPWLAVADVGLIPFVPCPLSDAVSPLKVYEYLAVGAAVVQRGLPDTEPYPGVRSAQTTAEFVDLVRVADRATLDEAERDAMRAFCHASTWVHRVHELDAALAAHLPSA